jgi:hypothetical protein
MTWHEIRYACGHSDRLTLTGNASSRKWQASKEAERQCTACWANAVAEDRATEAAAAAALAVEQQLPALTGSDKQVAWAETLRKNLLARADQELETAQAQLAKLEADDPRGVHGRRAELVTTLIGIISALQGVTAARWWIDNRSAFSFTYLVSSGALRLTTPDHDSAGFQPMGDNTFDVSAGDVIEHREKSTLIILGHSRWEGCTFTHPRSMLTEHADGSVTIRLPGDWKTNVTDDRRTVIVTAGELFLDRTTQRLAAPGAPFVVPNRWMPNDWNSFDVPTADVTRDPEADSVTVTLTCSVWEGLCFTHPATLVVDHADGSSTVRYSPDWQFKLRGGERTIEVASRDLWDDRANPLPGPGLSLATEQRVWAQVEFHPDRIRTVKTKKGSKAAVFVKFPWDADAPDAVVFHPVTMTRSRTVASYDYDDASWDDSPTVAKVTVQDLHVWRVHDLWEFTVKGGDDQDMALTGAEFADLVAPWAGRDPALDPAEYTPEFLEPVVDVAVPTELRIPTINNDAKEIAA